MGNISNKSIGFWKYQMPRKDAKKIAILVTAIIVLLMSVIGYQLSTAEERVLGEWKNGPVVITRYNELGYNYITFNGNGICAIRDDVENSIHGSWFESAWEICNRDITGIDIIIREGWEDKFPDNTIFHYNPFTNRLTRKLTHGSWVYKRIE